MIESYLSKTFGIEMFGAQRVCLGDSFFFDSWDGKDVSSFGYIAKGRATFSSVLKTIEAKEGDLIYIPKGSNYISRWSGDPYIEYFTIFSNFVYEVNRSVDRGWELQVIPCSSSKKNEIFFKEIFELVKKENPVATLSAMGKFYSFLSEIFPQMKNLDTSTYSKFILNATRYIEDNYARDFKIEELAKACFVSESHLYHSFREELNTTPIAYKNKLRIRNSIEQICRGALSVEEISRRLGFSSTVHFRNVFRSVTGISLSEYRKHNA